MFGGNIQVLAAPNGTPLWISAVEPGAVYDMAAARTHALPALYWAASQLHLPPWPTPATTAPEPASTPRPPNPPAAPPPPPPRQPHLQPAPARPTRPRRTRGRRTHPTLAHPQPHHPQPQPHRQHRPRRSRPQQQLEIEIAEKTSVYLILDNEGYAEASCRHPSTRISTGQGTVSDLDSGFCISLKVINR